MQPVIVRITHWTNAVGFAGLLISGMAILLAHPRLYWGETGTVETAALVELPLPFVFGLSGWGRSLHFLSGWLSVLSGCAYLAAAFATRHFRMGFRTYSASQRAAYIVVVFILFPLMLWTGSAMSPALTSALPMIVTALGGQQSARTLHFLVAAALVLFAVGHIAKVWARSWR